MTRSWSATSRLEAVDGNTTKQTQSRRTPLESGADCRSTDDRAAGGSPRSKRPKNTALVRTDTTIAHGLIVRRCVSSGNVRSQATATERTKQTQSRRTAVKSTASNDEPRSADLPFEIRGLCCVKASDSFVAHALSVPRRDSSRRPAQFGHPSSTNAPNTTKQTRSRRTPIGIRRRLPIDQRQSRGRQPAVQAPEKYCAGQDRHDYCSRVGRAPVCILREHAVPGHSDRKDQTNQTKPICI